MKYFFDDFGSLKKQIGGRDLFLFLDYDGTLTPIVDHPKKAALAKSTRSLLEKLSLEPLVNVSVVSGRALGDLRNRVGVSNISYVGNHGLEMDAPGVNFKGFDLVSVCETIDYLKKEISKELLFFKGAFLEDKGVTLSVHYRKLKEARAAVLKAFLHELTEPFLSRKQIRMGSGKKVLEIKPPVDWDKGKAVLWLLNQHKHDGKKTCSIYIGDDTTDEDAFASLKGKGITIKVGGQGDSAAEYYVKQQKEVIRLLKGLLALRNKARRD
ncbi:MAG: trehalose-phosphatase [Candidatus Omnitrophica bacterium]|nr:trehalose-phosphatase [Candidatus Omnitrophota bacterium]